MILQSVSRTATAALIAFAAFAIAPAHAQSAAETAITDWVRTLNDSPTWAADYQGLDYDAASDTATLTGLTMQAENADAHMDFGTITLAGFAEAPDGAFTASSLKVDGVTVKFGFVDFGISDAEFDDLKLPDLTGLTIDPERPFTSMIRAYAQAVKGRLAHGAINGIAIIEKIGDATARITYDHITVDGFADGKIRSVVAGPLAMQAPNPKGLVTMRAREVESRDVDLAAFVHVYDPDAYEGGVGDEVWRTAVAHAGYHDFKMELPGATVSIASITMDDARIRQPKHSFAEFFDLVMAHPNMPKEEMNAAAMPHALAMLSAFGLGRLSIDGIDVQATGIDHLSIGGFHFSDLSGEGLGEFAIDNVDAAVAGQGAVKVGRFAFGGLTFPSGEAIMRAVEAEQAGEKPDPKTLIPTLGFLEASAVNVDMAGMPPFALGRYRMDLGNYVGPVPTSLSTVLSGLKLPVDLIRDPQARGMLKQLGYDEIDADYGLKLGWHEANDSVTVDDLHFSIKGMGSLTASLALSGLTRQALENVESLPMALQGMFFSGAKITFKDDSITNRALAMQAQKSNQPLATYRQQLAGALPFMLSFVGNADFKAMLVPVFQAFIKAPGTVTVVAAPPSPVALSAIEATGKTAPQKLPDLLGVKVTGEPGPTPDDTAPGAGGSGSQTDSSQQMQPGGQMDSGEQMDSGSSGDSGGKMQKTEPAQ